MQPSYDHRLSRRGTNIFGSADHYYNPAGYNRREDHRTQTGVRTLWKAMWISEDLLIAFSYMMSIIIWPTDGSVWVQAGSRPLIC